MGNLSENTDLCLFEGVLNSSVVILVCLIFGFSNYITIYSLKVTQIPAGPFYAFFAHRAKQKTQLLILKKATME